MSAEPVGNSTRAVQAALVKLGWPIAVDGAFGPMTHTAVADFQRMWALSTIAADGWAGPQTRMALGIALELDGHVSTHYRFTDFRSKGNGWIRSHRALVRGLESLSLILGRKMRVLAGYRDPQHNRQVGGVANSQHLYGTAVDIVEQDRLPLSVVRSRQLFSGLGVDTGRVLHLDVRHARPETNWTRGSVTAPTMWTYR